MAFVSTPIQVHPRTTCSGTISATTPTKRPRAPAPLLCTPQIRHSSFTPRHARYNPVLRKPSPHPDDREQRVHTREAPRAFDAAITGIVREALELLAATTIVVPIFRRLNLSPILGFLLAGVVLGPHGARLIGDVEDISQLADLGVLFLLFEMGLELSLDRLRKLRKYAFGLGFLQLTATGLVLGIGAYGMGGSLTQSAVVGTALSLSSSAFILQILAEKGERQSRAGIATFGVLLMQDMAVVPLLLLVPFLGSVNLDTQHMGHMGPEAWHAIREAARHIFSALGTLNIVILAGGAFLKRVFTIVADSRSSEAFTSAVLLTVLGTAYVTEGIGLSMTLGSFLAGILLAESSFRSRIKIDLEPFRGLLLGLFFITTGMSLDMSLFVTQPGQILFLISSLIFCKSAILTVIGLPFGLSVAESLRVGLLLGQGGEFAFVLFALANKLGFLSDYIYSFLISTIVASMALTPLLYDLGVWLTPYIDKIVASSGGTVTAEATIQDVADADMGFVMICGYGPVGKVVGRMLSRKFIRWIAVDIDSKTVADATKANLPVVYGDIVRPSELVEANGLSTPDAFVITLSSDELVEDTLGAIRSGFPDCPVYVRAKNLKQQRAFLKKGARALYPESFETSLQLGQSVLQGFDTSQVDISAIKAEVRGDYGLNEVFKEYDEWFKYRTRPNRSKEGEEDDEDDGGDDEDDDDGNGDNGSDDEEKDQGNGNGAAVSSDGKNAQTDAVERSTTAAAAATASAPAGDNGRTIVDGRGTSAGIGSALESSGTTASGNGVQ